MIASLLDHIWQSSLFAGAIAAFSLLFRRNHASVRFWLWFAASLKFLVPFAVLAMLGTYLSHLFPAPLPSSILAMQPAAEKLSVPARLLVAPHAPDVGLLLLAGWLAGFAVLFGLRLLRWVRLRRLTDAAQDLAMPAPVRIKTSASLLEPGLVGIFQPMVLLPEGLLAHLSQPERDSILAHEFSHLRRRDNVTAAIHMTVEALFWFYPPVWFIGARLIAERERACDESVLSSGHDPEVYAGGILKVCKFCIQSPLACVSGVSGSDLANRVRQIMSDEVVLGLGHPQRLLLAGTASLALMLPVMAGFVNTPLIAQVQRKVIAVQIRAQQAVTAMVQDIGVPPPAPVTEKIRPRPKVTTLAALPLQAGPDDGALVPAAEANPPPADVPSTAAAPSLAQEAAAGEADAITCREPQPIPGSRLLGPQVCRTGRQWADLRARHQDIGPDGRTIIQLDGAGRVCNDMRTLDWATSNSGKLPAKFCF